MSTVGQSNLGAKRSGGNQFRDTIEQRAPRKTNAITISPQENRSSTASKVGKGSGRKRGTYARQHAQDANHVCRWKEANRRCSKGRWAKVKAKAA